MLRFLLSLVLLMVCTALVWLGGFVWFISAIPSETVEDDTVTDAIVVLTGGSGRVEHGVKQFISGKGKKLFISGVSKQVKVNELLLTLGLPLGESEMEALKQGMVLGFEAVDTKGNAIETADWVLKEKVGSVRLVTSNYHIPRSRMEIKRLLPNVTIIADPVLSENFKREGWWRYGGTTQLILSEYHKYLASMLQYWLGSGKDAS